MNAIRRILGIVWMLLGPAAVYFMVSNAIIKIAAANAKVVAAADEVAKTAAVAAKANTSLQWGIIITIFIPIMIGLVIFGYYAFQGAYDREAEIA